MFDTFRKVCAGKVAASLSQLSLPYTPTWGTMVSIKGPEIRTAMLKGGRRITLQVHRRRALPAGGCCGCPAASAAAAKPASCAAADGHAAAVNPLHRRARR